MIFKDFDHAQCSLIMQHLGYIRMDHVIKGHFVKGLQENDHLMVIFHNFFVKFHGKIFGSHNIAVLYPNLYYNKVCYKGISVYFEWPNSFPILSAKG